MQATSLTKKERFNLLIIIVVLLALTAVIFLIKRQQDIRNRAQGTGEVTLEALAANTSLNQGDQTIVRVSLTNGTTTSKLLRLAGIDIDYDKNIFEASDVACGSEFPSAANNQVVPGTVYISCFRPATQQTFNLTSNASVGLGTFVIKVKNNAAAGSYPLIVTRTKIPDDSGQDVSDVGYGSVIEVGGGGNTTPTNIPNSTITAKPPRTTPADAYTIDIDTKDSILVDIGQGPTPSGGPTPTGPTPSIDPNTPHVRFGITLARAQNKPDIKVRLKVVDLVTQLTPAPVPADSCQNPGPGQYYYSDIPMKADANGVYFPIPGGTFKYGSSSLPISSDGWVPLVDTKAGRIYSLAVKGPKHRSDKMITNFLLEKAKAATQEFDWSTQSLEPGDLPNPSVGSRQDCTVNSIDLVMIEDRIGATDQTALDIADVGYDGVVNGHDVAKVVLTLSTKPDDE